MTDQIYRLAASRFRLTELNMGEFSRIRSRGMVFDIRTYDAEKAGRLCLMEMKAFAGLMKMDTAVFSPTELDGPLFSLDMISAFGTCTLVLELYDTTISHPDFGRLRAVKEKYARLPGYDPGSHWSNSIRLPVSDYKKGKKLRADMEAMLEDYARMYFELLEECGACSPTEKKAANAVFADGLLTKGGPAVNQFKKMIGEDKTAEFIRKYMFCCV